MGFKRIRTCEEIEADFMAHVRLEMKALSERPIKITWAEWQEIRANTWERRLLSRNLDDDALCKLVEHCVKNATRLFEPLGEFSLATTYDEILAQEFLPMLVERLRAKIR